MGGDAHEKRSGWTWPTKEVHLGFEIRGAPFFVCVRDRAMLSSWMVLRRDFGGCSTVFSPILSI